MSTPSILEVAALAATRPGIDPPTPRWSATLAYTYGLPLSEADVDELVPATGRSRQAIVAHAADTLGSKRFRQLWARIGRRGRKSATAALIAVYEAQYGGHDAHIMPGEQALAAVISKDLAGASVVARFVRLYLDALGIRYSTTKIGAVALTEIEGCSVAIACLAAATEAPRGFAICCLVLDEWAFVSSDDAHVDTDKSILAGALPAMAQFPDALVIGISTGHGRDGVHYERVERGYGNDDEHEILSVVGASWDWSRDIDRAEAERIADGDTDVMCTEFEGGVSENVALWMPQADALAMFEPREGFYIPREPFMVVDFAEGGDTLAHCIGTWCDPDPQTHYRRLIPPPESGLLRDTFCGWERDEHGQRIPYPTPERPLLSLYAIGGFDGAEVRQLGMEQVVDLLGARAVHYGARHIIGDDRAGPYLEALFSQWSAKHRAGLRYSYVHYSTLKHEAALLCRSWARDRQILIEDHAEMRKQCLRYRRDVSGAGFKYGKPGQRDDYVCLLITLAVSMLRAAEHTQTPPRIDGAPTRRHVGGRFEINGR